MPAWKPLTSGLRVLLRRRAADRDLDDEVRHYLDEATADYVARGRSPSDARRLARRDLGGMLQAREQVRDAGWERLPADAAADLRSALRMLRRTPMVTAVIVLVVAIGSGAVSTVFSAMQALVLRPIAGVDEPDRLMALERTRRDGTGSLQSTLPHFQLLQEQARTIDAAAWSKATLTLAARDTSTTVFGAFVSGNFFDVLGVRAARGRLLAADDDRLSATPPPIVVAHRVWTTMLGAEPEVIGRTIAVNGRPFTLIGVTAPDFSGVTTGLPADAWVPLGVQPLLKPRTDPRRGTWLWVFGRLRAGATPAAAAQELGAMTRAHADAVGEASGPDAFTTVHVSPLTGVPHRERAGLLTFLAVLLAASTLVLLIGAVNVAALLSARSMARRREMAVRATLGAGRGRLVRQLMTEVLVLFALGGIGGLLLAGAATSAIERLPLPSALPLQLELSPDARVWLVAIATSTFTGLLFGIVPAVRAVRGDLTASLRDGSAAAGRRRSRLGRTLIVAQLAVSLVLLVAAGLFLRSVGRGLAVDTGFATGSLATLSFEPDAWGYDEARSRRFYERLQRDVGELPGVEAVAFSSIAPLTMRSSVTDVTLPGRPTEPVHTATVDPGYFDTVGVPIVLGRGVEASDTASSPPVAIVNQTFARRLAGDGRAIGSTFAIGGRTVTVVGVARDAKYAWLDEETPAFAYFPMGQQWQASQVLLVRSRVDPATLSAPIQRAIARIDPAAGRPSLLSVEDAMRFVLLPQRMAAIVTGALGAGGLVMAVAGLYGVLAYSARRRTREIGIRVALGAERRSVERMLLADGLWTAGAGLAIGLAAAAIAAPVLGRWLFDVSPFDPLTYAAAAAVFLGVAALASWAPARRAASADPLTALRTE